MLNEDCLKELDPLIQWLNNLLKGSNRKKKSGSSFRKFPMDTDFREGPENPLLDVPHNLLLDLQIYLEEAKITWEKLMGSSVFKLSRESQKNLTPEKRTFLSRLNIPMSPNFFGYVKNRDQTYRCSTLLTYITKVLATPSKNYKLTLISLQRIRTELYRFLGYLRNNFPL